MSTYEDNLLAARFAALAPTPLAADWDDVLGRAGAVLPRRRRLARSVWHGGRRRKLVVVVAVAVLVPAVAAAAYGTVRVLFLDRGFIGLPPVGATPSGTESGDLVVRWEGWVPTLQPQRDGRDIFRAWAYADGRIIWDRRAHVPGPDRGIPEGANEFNSGYLEQRLTPEGVQILRSAVAELFERTRTLLETVPADTHEQCVDFVGCVDDPRPDRRAGRGLALFVPPDYPSQASIEARDGGRFVRLQTVGTGGNAKEEADRREHFAGTLATPEQLSALRRVDALLTDPTSVLPPSAWAVRKVRAYVPSHYAVCIDTSPPKDASQVLSMLPARAADLLSDKSRTRFGGDLQEAREGGRVVVIGRSVTYCFKLATEEAREVADALSGLDPEPGWRGFGLAYRVAEPVNHLNATRIWFEPYFPDGRFTFSGPFG